jgi:predicted protein tyrosine phosphatase
MTEKNVFVYSIGAFEQLPEEFKKNKAIIRMHNVKNETWYGDSQEENTIWLFFDDIHLGSLTFLEKLKTIHLGMDSNLFSVTQAKKSIKFINEHKDKDFIIHCEYGRSRSVAFAIFLNQHYGYNIANKSKEELKKANTLILYLLNKQKQTT